MTGSEHDEVLISYILDSIEKITKLTKDDGNARRHLLTDWVTHDAIVHRLQTITESTQRLSSTLKETFPHIPWKKMAGFRNISVHQYLGDIDPEILWHVVEYELPLLQDVLKGYRPRR